MNFGQRSGDIRSSAKPNFGGVERSRMSAVIGSGSHCIHGISHPNPIFSSSFLILSGLIFRCLILSKVSLRISLFASKITIRSYDLLNIAHIETRYKEAFRIERRQNE